MSIRYALAAAALVSMIVGIDATSPASAAKPRPRPTPTPSAAPTLTPTPTPVPTVVPTPVPTASPSPSPVASASATPPSVQQLDQEQALTDALFGVVDMTAMTNTADAPGTASLAQTFTAGRTGLVETVSLHLGCCADAFGEIRGIAPGFGLIVGVGDVDASGAPIGNLDHGYAIVPATELSSDGSLHWVDIPIVHRCGETYSNCQAVVTGTRYAITISVYQQIFAEEVCGWIEGQPDCGYQVGRTARSDAAAGEGLGFWGQGWLNGVYQPGAWHREDRYHPTIPAYDLAFRTYIGP